MADIVIQKDGNWYYRGKEIIHPEILDLFKSSLTQPEEGKYVLEIGSDRAEVSVEDTPYFICRVDLQNKEDGASEYLIDIDDGAREILDPQTLSISTENVMYCRIRNGGFTARFLRRAYYQLAEFIEEDEGSGRFYLPQSGRKFYIAGT